MVKLGFTIHIFFFLNSYNQIRHCTMQYVLTGSGLNSIGAGSLQLQMLP